ncbi:hypothetical protein [Phenylobacterium sp.]|uniref:hypothetical protein n=1 Tax=Phenylobacterium sp. TaxID=1871053 RepID=UPI0025E3B7BC|nr:hypothetical protein [Phenylobacterium sp.]
MPDRLRLGATALAVIALSGCATGYPAKQIAKTGAALGAVQTTFADYYGNLNALRRDAYIRSQVYRGQTVNGGDPALKGSIYPDDAIQARLAALDVVGRYTKLLDAYASGSQAKDVGAAVGGLSDGLFALQARMAAAGDDAGLAAYKAPVSDLVTAVSTWIVDARLRSGFKASIGATTPKVRKVLELLKADAANVLQPTKQMDSHREFADLVTYYNDNAGKLDPAQRAALATALIDSAAARDANEAIDLVGIVTAADKAVAALQKNIDGAATPAETRAAVDEFAARVTRLKAIVDKLDAARKR